MRNEFHKDIVLPKNVDILSFKISEILSFLYSFCLRGVIVASIVAPETIASRIVLSCRVYKKEKFIERDKNGFFKVIFKQLI